MALFVARSCIPRARVSTASLTIRVVPHTDAIKIYMSPISSSTDAIAQVCNSNVIDEGRAGGLMKLAIRQAQFAFREKEVPIGSVLVDANGEVLATARNQVEKGSPDQINPKGHAEVIALKKAAFLLSEEGKKRGRMCSNKEESCQSKNDKNISTPSSYISNNISTPSNYISNNISTPNNYISNNNSDNESITAEKLLSGCTLITTLEPCRSCYDEIISYGLSNLVYSARDSVNGVFSTNSISPHGEHTLSVNGGLLADESGLMLRRFYKLRAAERFHKGDIDRAKEYRTVCGVS